MTARALALVLAVAALGGAVALHAQAPAGYSSPGEARAALVAARAEQRLAAARGSRLEAQAARASVAADKTARQAAAIAARIQQAEAGIAASAAQLALIERRREVLRERLAARQEPVVRLTGALQLLSRRPVVLGLLRPGSLSDMVHTRAVLEAMLPEVRRRTAGLRAEIGRVRALGREAGAEASRRRAEERALATRRAALAGIETRQRLASRAVRGQANREGDRAAALAEEARDLGALVGELAEAGALRRRLAALPGPVLRPARPGEARVIDEAPAPIEAATSLDYILPVSGSVVAGFGEASSGGGVRSRGLTLAPRPGAQVVAPAAGRVAFAGRYEGYGQIVILEHDGGWTTLVTDLARVSPSVGDTLVQGAPLGVAAAVRPTLTVELRKDGEPVDVLSMLGRR